MTNGNLTTILEILKLLASLGFGLSAFLLVILTLQSPKLLKVFLDFVRAIIKDFRTPPKPPTTHEHRKTVGGSRTWLCVFSGCSRRTNSLRVD